MRLYWWLDKNLKQLLKKAIFSNWYQNLDYKFIREHEDKHIIDLSCSEKTLGLFKKYFHSKPLMLDSPWSIPVHFTCNPLPLNVCSL